MTQEVGELAFEVKFDGMAPHTLYRVVSLRQSRDRTINHVNWFTTEKGAKEHAAWISDGRGKLLGIYMYDLIGEIKL